MRRNLFHCALTLILGAGCRQTADGGLAAPGQAATGRAQLGQHALLTHDQNKGTSPATTVARETQPTGSVLLAISMGRSTNFVAPTDSYHNAWRPIGRKNMYANGPFYTAVWAALAARGGAGHTLSADKPSDPADEISIEFIEIRNDGVVKAASYAYPRSGARLTAGSVTTDGPATLIAIWGGDSWDLKHTAVPGDGFRVIESYLELGPTSGVQVAIAVKQVAVAGTYTMSWTATPTQGAACYLLAVE